MENVMDALIEQMGDKIMDMANCEFPLVEILREYHRQEDDLRFLVEIGELDADEADDYGWQLHEIAVNAMEMAEK